MFRSSAARGWGSLPASLPRLRGEPAGRNDNRLPITGVQPGRTEAVQLHQPEPAFRFAQVNHEHRVGSPADLGKHRLGEGTDLFRTPRLDTFAPFDGILAR